MHRIFGVNKKNYGILSLWLWPSSIWFNKSDRFDLDKAQTKVIFDRSRGGGKISKVPLRIPIFPVEIFSNSSRC